MDTTALCNISRFSPLQAAILQRAMRKKKIKEYPIVYSTEEIDMLSPIHNSDVHSEDRSTGSYKLFEKQ